MTKLQQALPGAIATAEVAGVPSSVAGLVDVLGGTKAAATVAGVSQRTVQRWVKGERGEGGETRKPSEANRAKLESAAQAKAKSDAGAVARASGLEARMSVAVVVSPGGRNPDYREKDITVHLDPADAAAILDLIDQHKWTAAAQVFEEAVFDTWEGGVIAGSLIEDVYEMGITMGGA